MTKTILVLGGAYAGLTVTHTLLKKTLSTVKDYKIVLVAPETELYMNMASVRGIIPGQFGDEKLFQKTAPGFAQYNKALIEQIEGTATSLDPKAKAVTVSTPSGEKTLNYDILVLTTGSRTTSGTVPWKPNPKGAQATKDDLHLVQGQVGAAKSIVVGGAGGTGTETVGELAFEYGNKKEITLITSGAVLDGQVPANVSKVAADQLQSMGVKIVPNTRITSTQKLESGQTELTLSNGEKKVVDLYLPTGGVAPNSEYIPKHLLNEKGFVKVDDYLRVKDVKDVWAAGDITDLDFPQYVYADKQANALAKNLDLVLKDKEPVVYKHGGDRILAVTLGRSKGTGWGGSFKLPSFLVWWLKGRHLGTNHLASYASGSKF
ncbi:hypothetical protein B0O99DRAFT_521483 [Bisporella sp. PMI_857]|nr:hypothetical protein B0O99DRAFT_521483 [Bisporella sp. PMI_857]